MQTYILMTKLSPEVSKQLKQRAKLGRAWLDQVKKKCPEVKFISHYALSALMILWIFTKHQMQRQPQKFR